MLLICCVLFAYCGLGALFFLGKKEETCAAPPSSSATCYFFQEIPEVQVVASQTALNTSSTSTSSGVSVATHAATALAATVDVPIPPVLDDEQMLLRCQGQIDQCVHMLKTKKEVIARYEKQVAALLERVPRAVLLP